VVKPVLTKETRLNRTTFDAAIAKFGRKDITWTSKGTPTKDSSGYLTAPGTDTTSTIEGDLQYVTQQDKELLAEGWVAVGDAMFYCKHSYALQENDELTVDSQIWKLTKKVRALTVNGGDVCHQEWACTRVD